MADDKTYKLIANLHAMATHEGSNENEAAEAMTKMQKLLFKHNLELAEVLAATTVKGGEVPKVGHKVVSLRKAKFGRWGIKATNRSDREWRTRLLSSVARFNFGRTMTATDHSYCWVVATPENQEAIVAIYEHIEEQCQNISTVAYEVFKKLHGSPGREWRLDFFDGLTTRLHERLREQFELLKAETSASTALVVVSDKALQTYVDQNKGRGSTTRSSHGFGSGYAQGQSAADRVNLGRGTKELK